MVSGYSRGAWFGARPTDIGREMHTARTGWLTLAVSLLTMILIAITCRASGPGILVLQARAIFR